MFFLNTINSSNNLLSIKLFLLLSLCSISANSVNIFVTYEDDEKADLAGYVAVDENTTFGDLKNTISQRLNIPAEDLELIMTDDLTTRKYYNRVDIEFTDSDKITEKIPKEYNVSTKELVGFKYKISVITLPYIVKYFKKIKANIAANSPTLPEVNFDPKNDSYGGQAGREFFQSYIKILRPAFTKTLRHIKEETPINSWNQSDYEKLLNNIFDLLGAERKYIAMQTKTFSHSQMFGIRASRIIVDSINPTSFPAWYRLVNKQAQTFLSTLSEDQTAQILKRPDSSFPIYANCKNMFDLPQANFVNSARIEVCIPEDTKEPLTMLCHNSKFSSFEEQGILDPFMKAIRWDGKDENKFKKWLGLLLLKISHTSIYNRGQAAITEWLLTALAGMHGFNLTWSMLWQGPNNPNPDQHALSATRVETFLEDFKANTNLIFEQ